MKSGEERFSQRSFVSITTSGWRWLKVARLMNLNHISMITTMTGLICSIVQVLYTQVQERFSHSNLRSSYSVHEASAIILAYDVQALSAAPESF